MSVLEDVLKKPVLIHEKEVPPLWTLYKGEPKDYMLRVSYETRNRVLTLKQMEKHPNVDSVVKSALDVYEGLPKIKIIVGTVEVWSRSA